MKEYTIAEQFSLIALNAQDCKHSTAAKKAAALGIAAAKEIEVLLKEERQDDLKHFETQLSARLAEIRKMSGKERAVLEKEYTAALEADGVLKEIPNLLGCDIDYYTADITMRAYSEYKCEETVYQSIVEYVRAVILEPGEVPEDVVILLWLFRESGCIHELFSVQEQEAVEARLVKLSAENPFYRIVLAQEFHNSVLYAMTKYLGVKRNLFKNPYLEGVNLLFPFLDRRQAVFIDMVILGTSVKERREETIHFLEKCGHTCEEVKNGTETLLKIDNSYYRVFPTTRAYKLPVQGISLVPAYK